jgi:oxepin-CoA hydrolase/3-oxo-5,6-dehydrosuberyl-CoA semialdehyde dehydrogenase
VPALAALHGRCMVLDREAAPESTGHGSPLPLLKHGGPGRAGGGEELGGLRAVNHYLQRCAVQGSPTMLAAVTGEYVRGAKVETEIHPFRRHFEDLQIGEPADAPPHGERGGHRRLRRPLRRLLLHALRRGGRQGLALRQAHRARLLRAVGRGRPVRQPGAGPVLANYGLDTLRFVKPVAIGDTIQARLTAKRKIDRNKVDAQGRGQGVVAWDVEVTNQHGELVASYDILTLVAKKYS